MPKTCFFKDISSKGAFGKAQFKKTLQVQME